VSTKLSKLLYLSDGFVSFVSGCEGDKSVTPVHPGHGVHHETQVPDLPALLEQRNQIVLVNVARDLATEDLKNTTQKELLIVLRMRMLAQSY